MYPDVKSGYPEDGVHREPVKDPVLSEISHEVKTHRQMFLFAASFSWWFWAPDAGFAAGLSRAWQRVGKPAEAGFKEQHFPAATKD